MNHSRRLLILCAGILAALIITACTGQGTAVPAGNGSSSGRTAAEWQAVIMESYRLQNKQPWRYDSITTPEGGQQAPTTIEFVPPDRYRIRSMPGRDLVIVGEEVFVQNGQQWSRWDISADSIINPDSASVLEKSISSVQCASPETLDGKTVHACQYDSVTNIGGSDMPIHTKMWIDAASGLPYKIDIDGYVGSMDAQTGKVSAVKAKSSLIYFFDASITIEKPEVK